MVLVAEPPVVSKEPNNSKVEEGGEVELECEVRGTPTPKVMWLLNGEPLDNDTHALIRGLSSLPDLHCLFQQLSYKPCLKTQ